jgi:hypothetical protein
MWVGPAVNFQTGQAAKKTGFHFHVRPAKNGDGSKTTRYPTLSGAMFNQNPAKTRAKKP